MGGLRAGFRLPSNVRGHVDHGKTTRSQRFSSTKIVLYQNNLTFWGIGKSGPGTGKSGLIKLVLFEMFEHLKIELHLEELGLRKKNMSNDYGLIGVIRRIINNQWQHGRDTRRKLKSTRKNLMINPVLEEPTNIYAKPYYYSNKLIKRTIKLVSLTAQRTNTFYINVDAFKFRIIDSLKKINSIRRKYFILGNCFYIGGLV